MPASVGDEAHTYKAKQRPRFTVSASFKLPVGILKFSPFQNTGFFANTNYYFFFFLHFLTAVNIKKVSMLIETFLVISFQFAVISYQL